ncbi:MAG TPA: L,D-transpeptidase family protein [Gemmatimonadaceae bacterium]|nr:L,D-transpeptidase family protein [Gemmatimonadaceae bacterium]
MLHAILLGMLTAGSVSAPVALPAEAPAASVAGPTHGGGPIALADSIVIEKKAHRLTLYHMGRPMRTYLVALGADVDKDKVSAGDRRTPEGLFYIDSRNPYSQYHLSLEISYPDATHRSRAEAMGVSPGGSIMIHGLPNGKGFTGAFHRTVDWTNGCIALTDQEMDEIWSVVPIGTPVLIKR